MGGWVSDATAEERKILGETANRSGIVAPVYTRNGRKYLMKQRAQGRFRLSRRVYWVREFANLLIDQTSAERDRQKCVGNKIYFSAYRSA